MAGIEAIQQHLARRNKNQNYIPPKRSAIFKAKKRVQHENRMWLLIWEMLLYGVNVAVVLFIAYNERDANAFYMTRSIRNLFTDQMDDITNYGHIFDWLEEVAVPRLYSNTDPNYIIDDRSVLVGPARLRQLRMTSGGCEVHPPMKTHITSCTTGYSQRLEATSDYGESWIGVAGNDTSKSWLYTPSDIQQWYRGKISSYDGGGYSVRLGSNRTETMMMLSYLRRTSWLDLKTRAVFFEFTLYTTDVNLFTVVTILMERPGGGGMTATYEIDPIRLYSTIHDVDVMIIVLDALFVAFLVVHISIQAQHMKMKGFRAYMARFWTYCDLFLISASFAAIAFYVYRMVFTDVAIDRFRGDRSKFINFYPAALAHTYFMIAISFVIFFTTLKFICMLRTFRIFDLLQGTLKKCAESLLWASVLIGLVMFLFSFVGKILFGGAFEEYSSMLLSVETVLTFLLGSFNHHVYTSVPFLGVIYFLSIIVFLCVLLSTLYLTIMMESYKQTRDDFTPHEDEDVFNFIGSRFVHLLGLKAKKQ